MLGRITHSKQLISEKWLPDLQWGTGKYDVICLSCYYYD